MRIGLFSFFGSGPFQPVDDLTRLVGDLVGRSVLVEVQAVLRNVLPILHRLYVTLFRMEDAVDLLDRVDV